MPLSRLRRSAANTCPFCHQKAGNVITSIGGTGIGSSMGMGLNKHLQPHMLDFVLNIADLTHDDPFYYKNKPRIDEVAFIFQIRARELARESVLINLA